MFETKKLDVQKRQGVKLKRKYTPEGQYAKNARPGGGKN